MDAKTSSRLVEVLPITLFSTGKVTKDTRVGGYISLFTVPQGHVMPGTTSEILTPDHTNVVMAAQLGPSLGDVRLRRARVKVVGSDLGHTGLELHINGRVMFDASLAKMIDWIDLRPHPSDPDPDPAGGLYVSRLDTFQVRLFTAPIDGEAYVRVEFEGDSIKAVPGTEVPQPCPMCNGTGVTTID